MGKLSKREKTYLWMVIILLGILCVKSFWLDAYKAQNESEALFISRVTETLDQRFDNALYQRGILMYRIISVKEVTEEENQLVKKLDTIKGNAVDIELQGKYKARIRKYVLGLLPFGQETIHLVNQE